MASIVVNNQKITFNGNVDFQQIKNNGVPSLNFVGEYQNNAVTVKFDMKMKISYIKSKEVDLIKNDHIIFQRTPSGFFLLFEADQNNFSPAEEKGMEYKESFKNKDYEYEFYFVNTGEAEEKEEKEAKIDPNDVSGMVDSILKKYGVEEKSEDVSVVSEYMKTWKLEHPDE